jgi:hypothetical protein
MTIRSTAIALPRRRRPLRARVRDEPGRSADAHLRKAAIGALALGALGVGAFALGALAVGYLAIGRARIGRLEIDELVVRNVRYLGRPGDGPAA